MPNPHRREYQSPRPRFNTKTVLNAGPIPDPSVVESAKMKRLEARRRVEERMMEREYEHTLH